MVKVSDETEEVGDETEEVRAAIDTCRCHGNSQKAALIASIVQN